MWTLDIFKDKLVFKMSNNNLSIKTYHFVLSRNVSVSLIVSCTKITPKSMANICAQLRILNPPPPGSLLATDCSKAVFWCNSY